ncbi:MAG: phosphatidylserine decarboxylase [Deltaproteobacteria bacterium]|nr:MAG: phosphatidylserine decarboxylase [Deltaproteobacteria bacterium]
MAELSYTLLRLLPKNTLSRALGAACRVRTPRPMVKAAIRAFVRKYGVDESEAERPIEEYPTFSEFFTRRLKPGARPIAPGPGAVSPVDGTLGELGDIVEARLYQAKGKHYTLAELIGGPDAEEDARRFAGGSFCTIYLAPYNYHRIHAPLGGEITGYVNMPGKLWPVNPLGVRNVEKLFCVNERLTTFLETPRGAAAVVAVGATNVGRIRAVYDDVVTNVKRTRQAARKIYQKPIPIEKGGELAIFEMGSTVVALFAPGLKLAERLAPGQPIKLGEALEPEERASPATGGGEAGARR